MPNKTKMLILLLLCLACFSHFSCQKNAPSIMNKAKPLVFYNRQPSNPETGDLDLEAVHWNSRTCFVGMSPDAGKVQGEMVAEYLAKADLRELDRNQDGILGYVLLIGDAGHIDSNSRTEGVRRALGTWDGSCGESVKKPGAVQVGGKTCPTVELAAKVMLGDDGSTWNAAAAKLAMENWLTVFGTSIDFVVSNNDNMALSCISAAGFPEGIPVFGYDASEQALKAVLQGKMAGTVTQNADAQAAAIVQLLRNFLDGDTINEAHVSGFSKPDRYGNIISAPFAYDDEARAFYAESQAVTLENCADFMENRHEPNVGQTNAPPKKVLLTVFKGSNSFVRDTLLPSVNYYAQLLNINIAVVYGDGQSEETCLNKFTRLGSYDAFAVNMVRTNSGKLYTEKLGE